MKARIRRRLKTPMDWLIMIFTAGLCVGLLIAVCPPPPLHDVEIEITDSLDNMRSLFCSGEVVKLKAVVKCTVATTPPLFYQWSSPTNAAGTTLQTISVIAAKLGTNWGICMATGVAHHAAAPPCSTLMDTAFTGTGSNSFVVAKMEIKNIDVCKDEIKFGILPESLPVGEVKIIVKGPSDIEMVKKQLGGGKDQIEKFDWSKFPQAPGEEFKAKKIEISYKLGNAICKDSKDTNFTGYGVFRISKYVTPNDDIWNGPTENVSFKANGAPPFREVHSYWITRVRGQEGRGLSQDKVYKIRKVNNPNATVKYYASLPEPMGDFRLR